MPEGDTVHRLAQTLTRVIGGATILRSDVRVPRFALTDLAGQRVTGVVARGKHLLLRTDAQVSVHSHLEMEGAWHVYDAGARRRGPAHEARVVLETDRGTAVGYRLVKIHVLDTARESEVVGHLGPDPLAPDWDENEAVARLAAAGETAVAEALLDQRLIAGFGNVYKCEMLFLRGIDPWQPVEAIADPRALVRLGARLMQANLTRRERVTTGDNRRGRRLWVYGREGEPCRRCGTAILRRRQGPAGADRVTDWCPSCQPRLAPGAAPDEG